jgi:Na+/citrate or Na+/malate symporter
MVRSSQFYSWLLVVGRAQSSSQLIPSMVVISMFPINNVRMLLLSKIGEPYDPQTGRGVVWRNYPKLPRLIS